MDKQLNQATRDAAEAAEQMGAAMGDAAKANFGMTEQEMAQFMARMKAQAALARDKRRVSKHAKGRKPARDWQKKRAARNKIAKASRRANR